jgi:hypothetical protein
MGEKEVAVIIQKQNNGYTLFSLPGLQNNILPLSHSERHESNSCGENEEVWSLIIASNLKRKEDGDQDVF